MREKTGNQRTMLKSPEGKHRYVTRSSRGVTSYPTKSSASPESHNMSYRGPKHSSEKRSSNKKTKVTTILFVFLCCFLGVIGCAALVFLVVSYIMPNAMTQFYMHQFFRYHDPAPAHQAELALHMCRNHARFAALPEHSGKHALPLMVVVDPLLGNEINRIGGTGHWFHASERFASSFQDSLEAFRRLRAQQQVQASRDANAASVPTAIYLVFQEDASVQELNPFMRMMVALLLTGGHFDKVYFATALRASVAAFHTNGTASTSAQGGDHSLAFVRAMRVHFAADLRNQVPADLFVKDARDPGQPLSQLQMHSYSFSHNMNNNEDERMAALLGQEVNSGAATARSSGFQTDRGSANTKTGASTRASTHASTGVPSKNSIFSTCGLVYLQPAVQKVGTSFEWFPDLGAFRDFRRATERICSMRFADDRALLGDSDEGALSALPGGAPQRQSFMAQLTARRKKASPLQRLAWGIVGAGRSSGELNATEERAEDAAYAYWEDRMQRTDPYGTHDDGEAFVRDPAMGSYHRLPQFEPWNRALAPAPVVTLPKKSELQADTVGAAAATAAAAGDVAVETVLLYQRDRSRRLQGIEFAHLYLQQLLNQHESPGAQATVAASGGKGKKKSSAGAGARAGRPQTSPSSPGPVSNTDPYAQLAAGTESASSSSSSSSHGHTWVHTPGLRGALGGSVATLPLRPKKTIANAEFDVTRLPLPSAGTAVRWRVRTVVHDNNQGPCALVKEVSRARVLVTPHGFNSMLLLFQPLASTFAEGYPRYFPSKLYGLMQLALRHTLGLPRSVLGLRSEPLRGYSVSVSDAVYRGLYGSLRSCRKSLVCRHLVRNDDVLLGPAALRRLANFTSSHYARQA